MPVNVIRPDGSVLRVSAAEAKRLEALGYRAETPEERGEAAREAAVERRLDTVGQKVLTFGEGVLSGASVGLLDPVMADEATSERAAYNPGYRLAGEILGGVAPAVTGGAGLGRLTISGALGRGAARATRGIASPFARGAARTGLEGAGLGAGSAVTRSSLSGDPLTVEAVAAGAGWGALYGAALGGPLGGIEARATRLAERSAANALERQAVQNLAVAPEKWGRLRGAMDDMFFETTKAVEDAKKEITRLRGATRAPSAVPSRADDLMSQVGEVAAASPKKPGSELAKMVELQRDVSKGLGAAETVKGKIRPPVDVVEEIGAASVAERVMRADKAKRTLEALTNIRDALNNIPKDLAGFLRMKPDRFEKAYAGLTHGVKVGREYIPAVTKAVEEAAEEFVAAAGVKSEATGIAALRETWTLLREATAKKSLAALVKSAPESQKKGVLAKIMRRVASYAGWRQGVKSGGVMGGMMGARVGGALAGYALGGPEGAAVGAVAIGARASMAARIRDAIGKWGPGAARLGRDVLPRAGLAVDRALGDDPLRMRLDGTYDDEKDDRTAAMNRLHEIAGAQPNIRDTAYRVAEQIELEGHPEFAAALAPKMVHAFEALMSLLPKDPGTVLRGGRSQWKTDAVQTAQVRRVLEVFHTPVEAIVRMIKTGHVIQEQVKALEIFWPAVLQDSRSAVMERLASEPDWLYDESISQQNAVSTFLGVPLHSSMRPQFVAAQQQMFAERALPRPASEAYPGGAGASPTPDSPMATPGQRVTEY